MTARTHRSPAPGAPTTGLPVVLAAGAAAGALAKVADDLPGVLSDLLSYLSVWYVCAVLAAGVRDRTLPLTVRCLRVGGFLLAAVLAYYLTWWWRDGLLSTRFLAWWLVLAVAGSPVLAWLVHRSDHLAAAALVGAYPLADGSLLLARAHDGQGRLVAAFTLALGAGLAALLCRGRPLGRWVVGLAAATTLEVVALVGLVLAYRRL